LRLFGSDVIENDPFMRSSETNATQMFGSGTNCVRQRLSQPHFYNSENGSTVKLLLELLHRACR
jgi:hypothetical protein